MQNTEENNVGTGSENSTRNDSKFDIEAIFRAETFDEVVGKNNPEAPQGGHKEETKKGKTLKVVEPKRESEDDNAEEEAVDKKGVPAVIDSEESKEKKKHNDWKSQYEKIEKNYKETRKWAEEVKSQNALFKNKVEKLIAADILNKEIGDDLLKYSSSKDIPDDNSSVQAVVARVWDTEIENLRKYGNRDDIDEHIKSLEHFLANSSKEEIQSMVVDIIDLAEEDPVLFTKKLLDIGKDYYEDVYKEFSGVGNIKGLKSQYEKELTNYQKTVDKLEKEIVKLKKRYEEDYDEKPNYRIPQSSGENSMTLEETSKHPGSLIDKMNQGKYRPDR